MSEHGLNVEVWRLREKVLCLRAEIEQLRKENIGVSCHCAELIEEIARLRAAQANIKAIVDEQANDEGLWFVDGTCAEAYVQQALRRLHAAIEDKTPEQCAMDALEQKVDTE